MALAEDFRSLIAGLPEEWADARFVLRLGNGEHTARAAALLGGINAGRRGDSVRFYATRRGEGHAPDVVARALRRLDAEGIRGGLELVGAGAAEVVPDARRETLAARWDAALTGLPPDWSDVYAELELNSTDYLERAALLMAPLNPARYGRTPGFRFRVARVFGYGAEPGVVRRCLERLDDDGVRGDVRILRALSDTRPWGTQGPVWYVGGKAV